MAEPPRRASARPSAQRGAGRDSSIRGRPQAQEPPRAASDRVMLGVLVRHGRAPLEFRTGGEPSYFVTLKTDRGERTVWGRGLERALVESRTQPQVGEAVGVRENGITPVTFVMRERNPRGEIVTVSRADTPRGHWIVERREWFDERSVVAETLRNAQISRREAIRNHPELLGAYWALDSAAKVAETRIKHEASRERFVGLVRETLAHAIERGEPIAQPHQKAQGTTKGSGDFSERVEKQPPERSR